MRTEGLSPKVATPALVLFAAGAVLVAGGILLGDETLRTLGYGALGSSLAAFGAGYAAPPGVVVPKVLPEDPATGPDPS